MFEIEIKVRIEDPIRVEHSLEALGSIFVNKEQQKDTYFRFPFRDFQQTGEVLRVRKQILGRNLMTYKGPKLASGIKVREEIELDIGGESDAIQLLRKLRFEPWVTVEKERIAYRVNNFLVSLDKVKDLGIFMEIETKADDIELKKIEQEVFKLLDNIGVSRRAIEKRTYLEMILEKQSKS